MRWDKDQIIRAVAVGEARNRNAALAFRYMNQTRGVMAPHGFGAPARCGAAKADGCQRERGFGDMCYAHQLASMLIFYKFGQKDVWIQSTGEFANCSVADKSGLSAAM